MPTTTIIAEIGTSHQGDLGKALELIHAAREAGADTAKFQWVYADEIIHPKTGVVQLPTGNVRLYDRFKALEQGPDFFARLKEACEAQGLEFLCTPFGVKSARELWRLGARRFKIASPELNHLPLIELLALTGRDLIISSGVSRLADIEEALDTVKQARSGHCPHLAALHPDLLSDMLRDLPDRSSAPPSGGTGFGKLHELPSITLLHCMTSYPAPESEYNLLLVRTLRGVFGHATGISDHSLDPVLVPAVSVLLGGTIIEKHFTLSNDTDGLDDPIALAPTAFARMVQTVRALEYRRTAACSDDPGRETRAEAEMLDALDGVGVDVDPLSLRTMLGTGVKALAASERDNYGRTNRSIHAVGDLKAGTVLGPDNVALLRTEKVLRPGIHPRHALQVVGRRLSQDVPDGEGIRWNDLLG